METRRIHLAAVLCLAGCSYAQAPTVTAPEQAALTQSLPADEAQPANVQPEQAEPAETVPYKTPKERLRDLKEAKEQGLITPEEYFDRRGRLLEGF